MDHGAELTRLLNAQSSEPLLTAPESYALVIRDQELWELYEEHFALFWAPKEIDTSRDAGHWAKLTPSEQHYLGRVLAFFATADGIVFKNLKVNFENEVTLQEAKFFYGFQGMIENVHSQVYMNLLRAYITDTNECDTLIGAIENVPSIKRKAEWALRHFDVDSIPFAIRLIAFACVEGIFFSGAFCSIFWLKGHKRGLLDALTYSNQLISRDEGLHTDFAVALFSRLVNKPSEALVHSIIDDAVKLESEFTRDALDVTLINMSSDKMNQYIQFAADRLLSQLSYNPLYHSKNPFPFMEMQSMRVTTNFFESKVAEYALAPDGDVSMNAAF
jgi:ribonucleotide reductase beta subunit family protein with ferritin-like domain